MKNKLSIWHIIAGVLWAIVSIMYFTKFGELISEADSSDGAAVAIAIFFAIGAGYVLCSIGMFMAKLSLVTIGARMTAIAYILIFVFWYIGISQQVPMDELLDVLGFSFAFFLLVGAVAQVASYMSCAKTASVVNRGGSVRNRWFRPAAYFAVCLICMIIALNSIPGSKIDIDEITGLVGGWQNILWIVIFILSGLAFYSAENPKLLYAGQQMNQQNPYGQANMYGVPNNMYVNQQMNQQNPYGQANMYGVPNNMYVNQQTNQQNSYEQVNMYGQPNTYADPNIYGQPNVYNQDTYNNQQMNQQYSYNQNMYANPDVNGAVSNNQQNNKDINA